MSPSIGEIQLFDFAFFDHIPPKENVRRHFMYVIHIKSPKITIWRSTEQSRGSTNSEVFSLFLQYHLNFRTWHCFMTSMIPLCQAGGTKKFWPRDFGSSILELRAWAESSSDVKGTGVDQVNRHIHSMVLETLEEVLNFHAYYGREIPYNSCLTQAQALFDKALHAVTAGCKTEQERISTSEQGFHFLPLECQWIKMTKITACEYWCNYPMVPHIIMQNKSIHKLM